MTTTPVQPFTVTGDQRRTIVAQIGMGTVLSVSGGRVAALADGIELPVSSGYRVRVHLTPADVYTVERVMVRGRKEFPKGERTDVHCEDLAETVYRAGMFRSFDTNEW
jgi:hypothetical protein